MHRAQRAFTIATLLCALLPALASAQDLVVADVEVEGRDPEMVADLLAVNIAECAAPPTTTVSITNFPIDTSTWLDVWRGRGELCNEVGLRDGADEDCDHLSLATDQLQPTDTEPTLVIDVDELVDCDGGDATYSIFLLATDTSMSRADIGTAYGTFDLEVDLSRPGAPTDVRGGEGDTQVEVSWDYTGEDLERFEVWVDTSGCSSSVLQAGDAVDDPEAIGATRAGDATSADFDRNVNPASLGLEYGESAAVTVVAIDDAFNVSPIGEVACITRVETTGFCDEEGRCDSGWQCSARGGAGGAGWPAAVGLAALLGTLGFRRRRRR